MTAVDTDLAATSSKALFTSQETTLSLPWPWQRHENLLTMPCMSMGQASVSTNQGLQLLPPSTEHMLTDHLGFCVPVRPFESLTVTKCSGPKRAKDDQTGAPCVPSTSALPCSRMLRVR